MGEKKTSIVQRKSHISIKLLFPFIFTACEVLKWPLKDGRVIPVKPPAPADQILVSEAHLAKLAEFISFLECWQYQVQNWNCKSSILQSVVVSETVPKFMEGLWNIEARKAIRRNFGIYKLSMLTSTTIDWITRSECVIHGANVVYYVDILLKVHRLRKRSAWSNIMDK